MDEEELKRLAAEALLAEAEVGARRAAMMGPTGWIKKKESINKRFLNTTLKNAILANRRKKSNIKNKNKDRKSPEKNEEDKE